jgi:hypothetical protein
MSKRTVQEMEGGMRRGREESEVEGEQSVAGSGFQRADPETLARRRLLRLNNTGRAQENTARQNAFANISTTSGESSSTSATAAPFVWGSGFYNPPQKTFGAPSQSLVAGGKIDNTNKKFKSEKDDEEDDDDNSEDGDEDPEKEVPPAAAAQKSSWTTNPFTVKPAATSGFVNPFASAISSTSATTTTGGASMNPFAQNNTDFSFSFAPPPTSFGDSTKSDSSAGASTAGSNNNAALLAAAPTVVVAAEASEDALYSTDACKLYLFTKDEEGKSSWKERGAGVFRIVLPKVTTAGESSTHKPHHARLIMRNSQTKKGILNCPVDESLKVGKAEEAQLMFTSAAADDVFGGPPPADTVQSFLLRASKMAGKEIIPTIVKHIEEQQKRVA